MLNLKATQSGVVLLLMVTVLFASGATILFTVLNNNEVTQRRAVETGAALQSAREAIIAFAVLYGDHYGDAGAGPGHLFCPDTNNNGLQNTPCAANSVGRLPRSVTLPSGNIFPLSNFAVSEDQQFWYAVSSTFKAAPFAALNASVSGALTLDGKTDIAAVIIAPGPSLSAQTRINSTASNYLEGSNTALPNFISNWPADPNNFNDRVLAITGKEIMSPASARVAERIKTVLAAFHGVLGRYPLNQAEFANAMTGVIVAPPTAIPAMPAWYATNNWPANTAYANLSTSSGTLAFTACGITYTLNFSITGISKSQSQC